MSRTRYRLTIRHGPRVEREAFETLDQAMEAMACAADMVRAEGPLESVKSLRDFEPSERVAARIELSTGGWLRRREAGVDVMGDGDLVAFAGGLGRRPLEPGDGGSPFDAVRRELGD
jgi:hypothetical protein